MWLSEADAKKMEQLGPLHTVNKSPFVSRTLEQCLARLGDGAALLLIENGVYAALADGAFAGRLAEAARRHSVYALAPDLAARGLEGHALVEGVKTVDYQGFVALAVRHPIVQSWT
jgi:tRNA 2-thiouridine synthesizing protein B